MNTFMETARLFSGGEFEQAADQLADNIEWNIFEDSKCLQGKNEVLSFCRQVATYFSSVTTNFEEYGSLSDGDKVAIYGHAEFIRDGKVINKVNSSDFYEFNADGKIQKIYSYCNSISPTKS